MKTKKRICILLIFLAALASMTLWVMWGNTALMVHEIVVTSERLPEEFSGFRIAQISDLHNAEFGEHNETLLQMLKGCDADIIVITGDLIDSRWTDIAVASAFAAGCTAIAPTYYVTGNHEARVPDSYEELEAEMESAGVHVLHGEGEWVKKDGAAIALIGIDDPSFYTIETPDIPYKTLISQDLAALKSENTFTVLLSHRPELFELYTAGEMDLIFSGHAHGGQFRLPFIGGLIAPNQGLFPKYDAGLYTQGNTNMIVSRGLGNSLMPVRFHNRPEIVVAELSC